MNQAPIRQKRIDKKQRNSDKTNANLELPKITGKVEEANSILADPLQLSKASEREGEREEIENMMREPWFDNGDETPAVRQKKVIKQQIASILGSDIGQQSEASVAREVEEMSPDRIISKMKKYQPINSSFSLQYGEKKSIEQRNSKAQMLSTIKRRKILNLPALNLRGQSTHSREQLQLRIQDLYSQRQARTPSKHPQKFSSFINKIKQIYKEGNALHHKSETLIHRIDKVSEFLGQKFDRFDEQSSNMLADVGTYHLQQETNGEYKKMMMQGLSRRLRK